MERITEKVENIDPGTIFMSIGITGLAIIAAILLKIVILPLF
jgi:hypothetical protein